MMAEHKKTMTHYRILSQILHVGLRGGQYGKISCDCGLMITWTQLKTHLSVKAHKKFLQKKLTVGMKICDESNLPYEGALLAHQNE